MDIDFSKIDYYKTLDSNRRVLFENFSSNSILFYNGGQFTIKLELILYIKMLINTNETNTILIDDRGLPICVKDVIDFDEKLTDKYTQAKNEYYVAYEKLTRSNKIEQMVD